MSDDKNDIEGQFMKIKLFIILCRFGRKNTLEMLVDYISLNFVNHHIVTVAVLIGYNR